MSAQRASHIIGSPGSSARAAWARCTARPTPSSGARLKCWPQLFHPVAREHFDDAGDAVGFGEAGVTPSGGVIVAEDVHFGERGVGGGEIAVEADRSEEE